MPRMDESLPEHVAQHVRRLEERLAATKASLIDYKLWVEERFTEKLEQLHVNNEPPRPQDDDTHYFSSYAENGQSSRNKFEFPKC